MAEKKSGLGRGLGALFADNTVEETLSQTNTVKLNINDIEPNRDQPRKIFDEKALSELADSISQHGLIQALLVRPMPNGTYQLVAGERRWRASRIAGLSEVPVIIRELSDDDVAALALIENLQREDLNAIEEANGIGMLMERFSLTQEQAALKLGKSRPYITNSLRLLKLPKNIQSLVESDKISAGHAKSLLSLESDEQMTQVAELITQKNLSVRQTEELVKKARKQISAKKPAAGVKNVYFNEVSLSLSQTLGRRVNIKSAAKKGSGTLEIEFYNEDDLKNIAMLLDRGE